SRCSTAVPASPRRSRRKCAATSARSSSAPPCRGPCASPRRRAMACPQLPTTVAPPEPTPTGRWRWSLSSAPESLPRRGPGRGLDVRIGGQPPPSERLEIPVDAIHPNPKQPRRRFEAEAASGLADSVKKQGIIQPLLVRPRGVGGYEIVAGERR